MAPLVGTRARTPAPKKEPAPHPTIRAAAIETRDRRGLLMLVADYAPGRSTSRRRWRSTT